LDYADCSVNYVYKYSTRRDVEEELAEDDRSVNGASTLHARLRRTLGTGAWNVSVGQSAETPTICARCRGRRPVRCPPLTTDGVRNPRTSRVEFSPSTSTGRPRHPPSLYRLVPPRRQPRCLCHLRSTVVHRVHVSLFLVSAVSQPELFIFGTVFGRDAKHKSLIATATWLGGWVGGCLSQPVLYQND